ncbi:MAG: regulatory protein RecX [Sphingomonas sp.]
MRQGRTRGERPPLDGAALERFALRYVERYATTRARLSYYLRRKLRERGWNGGEEPPVEAIVERLATLGYVDDTAFADGRAATLSRRGLGERRIAADLRAAGIAERDCGAALAAARDQALATALRYAQKRRIGPFAASPADHIGRKKALATMLRAGHPIDLAREIVSALPGEEIVPNDT